MAAHVWRLGSTGDLSLDSLLSVEAGVDWGRLITDLATTGGRRGNFAATLAEDLDYLEHRRDRAELDVLKRAAQANDDESLRRFTSRRRTPDARRLPR